MTEKIERIADHYGRDRQLVKLCEECGELTTAAAKYVNASNGVQRNALLDNLISELADIIVMAEQAKYLLGVEEKVNKVAEQKLDRQIKRIEQEQEFKTN